MKATGIVRRIDDLGRVVIPKEIRKTMRINEGSPMEIFTDRQGEIILKKYSPIGELGTFAKEYAEALAQAAGCMACITDRDQVIAAAGSGAREFAEKRVHRELEEVIADRKNLCVTEKDFVKIVEDDRGEYGAQVIYTITCAGDAVGIFSFVGEGCHEGVAASVWESGAGRLVPAVQVGVGTPDGPAG